MEFGLISIVMLTLIIYVMQFAVWFWAYQVGAHAVREAARVGAVDPCDLAAMNARFTNRVGSAAAAPATAVVTRSASPIKVGDEVTVSVTFNTHELTNGFLPFALPAISKSATARVENVPAGPSC